MSASGVSTLVESGALNVTRDCTTSEACTTYGAVDNSDFVCITMSMDSSFCQINIGLLSECCNGTVA
jgi:hypothetical protein